MSKYLEICKKVEQRVGVVLVVLCNAAVLNGPVSASDGAEGQ